MTRQFRSERAIESTGSSRPSRPNRHRTSLLGLAAVCLASCQTYRPIPLEPEVHRSAWHARTPDVESIEEFLERTTWGFDEGPVEFDPTDGLTLSEGQLVAAVFNAGLKYGP